MRGPNPEDILATPPPDLRQSKATKAHLDMRTKILTGEYKTGQAITAKEIEDTYNISNTAAQTILLRLAIEGLIRVLPVKEKTWPNNAAINEYQIADLTNRTRMFSTRQGDFIADISQDGSAAYKEKLKIEVEYADKQVADLLEIEPGDPVVHYRNLQRRDERTIVCINDHYLPFWFAEMIPELEKPDNDTYQLMRQLGKNPVWCTETVDVTHASSVERERFDLSADDPSALLKIVRRSFDAEGHPLDVQFLTDRGDTYRLHYSFPLYKEGVPENLRDK